MNARAGFFAAVAAVLFTSRAWSAAAPASALPGSAFPGDRYADLWTKSPFAIATPDAPAASEDYELVGMAQFDGISYISLIDKQNQNHFVLSSDKPIKDAKHNLDLKLVSITHGRDGSSAVILRNGESLTLREEQAPASGGPPGLSGPGGIAIPPPGMVPSPNPSVGGTIPAYTVPPPARFHRRFIHIPPPPH